MNRGRQVIQYPKVVVAPQGILREALPEAIVECDIATTVGGYGVVDSTVVECLPAELHDDRPWGPGNSLTTSVAEFVEGNPHFEVDRWMDENFAVIVGAGGVPACLLSR